MSDKLEMTGREAMREAMRQAMIADDRVFLMGEDVRPIRRLLRRVRRDAGRVRS